jgi:hypothetical protein
VAALKTNKSLNVPPVNYSPSLNLTLVETMWLIKNNAFAIIWANQFYAKNLNCKSTFNIFLCQLLTVQANNLGKIAFSASK